MKQRKIWPLLAAVFVIEGPVAAEPSGGVVDTRGPVQNAGMTVQVDQEGVQAPGYVWPKPEAKDSWSAQWIGSAAPEIPNCTAHCLRKEITLTGEPKKVTAWITSDNYLLYVNGKPAARGPADAGHDFTGAPSGHRFYDYRDLTPLFIKAGIQSPWN